MNNEKKQRKTDIFFVAMMAAIGVLLLWKAQYGYGADDEPFYLTTAHRLAKGDSLLSDEWHLAQMSSLLVYPFMKLYLALGGTTEGILFNFRLIFVAVKMVIAAIMYLLLRKRYQFSAAIAVIVFLLFTPYNLLQLCYNSMGLIGLLMSAVLLITYDRNGSYKRMRLICSGLFLAAAVLNCPYLVLVYVALAVTAIFLWVVQKKKDALYELGYITLGCGILAVIFFAFVLSRASIHEIILNLPEMMKDPAHPIKNVKSMLRALNGDVFNFYKASYVGFFVEAFLITVDGIWNRVKYGKKEVRYGSVYLWTMLLIVSYSIVILAKKTLFYYNLIMFPLAFFGVILIYLSMWNGTWKKIDKGAIVIGIYGVVYAILLQLSSDNLLTIVSCGMAITAIGTILLTGTYIRQEDTKIFRGKAMFACLVCVQIGTLLYSVTHHAYWEDNVQQLTVKVEKGPLKGVKTSKEHAEEYYQTLEELDYFLDKESGTFAYFSQKSYSYLYVDFPYGTHSGSSGSFKTQCLLDIAYFKLHPEKIPDYIYIEKKNVEKSFELYLTAKQNGYQVEKLKYGYALQKRKE